MEASDKLRHYAGEDIEISYDARRCIHAAECIHGLSAVFDGGRGLCLPRPALTRSLA